MSTRLLPITGGQRRKSLQYCLPVSRPRECRDRAHSGHSQPNWEHPLTASS